MQRRSKRIALRLTSKERERIDKLVEAGKFKSISEVMREALKEFLSKQLGEPKP